MCGSKVEMCKTIHRVPHGSSVPRWILHIQLLVFLFHTINISRQLTLSQELAAVICFFYAAFCDIKPPLVKVLTAKTIHIEFYPYICYNKTIFNKLY